MGGASAVGGMVMGFVCTFTEWAYDGAFSDGAAGNGVVKGMTVVTATEDGECCEFLNNGGTSEE